MTEVTLHLPWPPSVNHYWRYGRGHFYISEVGEAYQACVAIACRAQGFSGSMLTGPLAVTLDAHPPDRRVRDLDNIEKALWDALRAACVYKDDSQIKRKLCEMLEPERGGAVVVRITEMEARPLGAENAAANLKQLVGKLDRLEAIRKPK